MSVELDPVELGFKRPFNKEVSQVLRLRNPNSDPVAFKVKTTAPKQYCVRPNSGRIEAGAEVEVQVLLQAMREDPPLDAKCRDKFLVQSVAVAADKEFNNVSSIWSHIEQTSKSSIQEKKIRVVFLPADSSTTTPAKSVNGISNDAASSHRSPSPEAVTPHHGSSTAVGTLPRREERQADNKYLSESVESAYNPTTEQSTLKNAASAVAGAVPTSTDDVKVQLEQAKVKISQLSQQLHDQAQQGLRQRKPDTSAKEGTTTTATAQRDFGVQHNPAGGVPVQIVAGLCLLSFLLAYFFF